MVHVKQVPIISSLIVALITIVIAGCAGSAEVRQTQSFDSNWRFKAGEIKGAESPDFNDSSWLNVDVPHDWSIEGLAHSDSNVEDANELAVVRREWKFNKGDDTLWKNPGFDDASWQIVKLPAHWEDHSNYTEDNVYGWFRRELTIPAESTTLTRRTSTA